MEHRGVMVQQIYYFLGALATWQKSVRLCTVHIGYSAIGYSVKSVIVSMLGWSRFPYSKNYWI